MTLRQFAERQEISIHTARAWRRKGLPIIKPAGQILVDVRKADKWFEKTKRCDDAITYQTAANLIQMSISHLRYLKRKDPSFKSVLIKSNQSVRISKTRFLEWAVTKGLIK